MGRYIIEPEDITQTECGPLPDSDDPRLVVASILRCASRIGSEKDKPEGSRFITLSDTLAKAMARWLDPECRAAERFGLGQTGCKTAEHVAECRRLADEARASIARRKSHVENIVDMTAVRLEAANKVIERWHSGAMVDRDKHLGRAYAAACDFIAINLATSVTYKEASCPQQ